MHEACGVFGIYAHDEDIARLTFFALFALQHRGQESAGIATTDGKSIQVYAKMGLVSQVFTEDTLSKLTGHIAIGHNRYSTRGSSHSCNVQPIIVGKDSDTLAIAHNGNIPGDPLETGRPGNARSGLPLRSGDGGQEIHVIRIGALMRTSGHIGVRDEELRW